jgi:hypothetical protein
MKRIVGFFLILVSVFSFFSCEDEDDSDNGPYLIVKFQFDPNQARLNNLGQPATIPSGHAAQSPDFSKISAHYFELAPTAYTQLTEGAVLYHADETTQGGSVAIDFSKAVIVREGEGFLKIPLSQVPQGSYEYVRVSLAYQEYNISIRNNGADYQGKLASFVGFNNYITTHTLGNNSFPVNGNRLQGYWAFALNDVPYATSGQAPAGATTVPNPISTTFSPIEGSYLPSAVTSCHSKLLFVESDSVNTTSRVSLPLIIKF